MIKSLKKYLALTFGVSALTLSACASQNGTSRYGGEPIVDCVPASMPCGPVIAYRPVPVQAPPPVYGPAPAPVTAPLPTPLPPAPASAAYKSDTPEAYTPEPYTSEPYVPEPYVPEPYTSEPYTPPLRNNRPVVDDPAELPCPEGSIPGYGGTDCIPITVPRK